MDVERFEKYLEHLIKNTNFLTDKVNTKKNIYLKISEKISQQEEEELIDDDLQLVAGGLNIHDKEKHSDIP